MQLRLSNDQIDQLQQELIQAEGAKLELEQDMLEMVEQRKKYKSEIRNHKESIDL